MHTNMESKLILETAKKIWQDSMSQTRSGLGLLFFVVPTSFTNLFRDKNLKKENNTLNTNQARINRMKYPINTLSESSPSSSRPLLLLMLSLLLASVQGQTICASTADCEAGAGYCSGGTCIPIGSCQKEVDCFNRENNFAEDGCIGYLECQENTCVKTCSDSICCPAATCQTSDCEGAVSCVDDNCGDCVWYFDEKGSKMCPDESKPEPNTCSSNADCHVKIEDSANIMSFDAQPFCAAGVCADPGTCATDQDCVNPSNPFAGIECLGPLVCEQSQCTRDCDTGSICKKGVDQVSCFVDPCTTTDCPESTGCVADYCGNDCKALHFDAAGKVLRECNEPLITSRVCFQDSDCNGGGAITTHYCAASMCKPMGSCDSTSDCLNPANEFGVASCIGYSQCTASGQCEKVCSNEEHCCFIQTECKESLACPDAATCVKDNCNQLGGAEQDHCGAGSGTFYFNISGYSICTDASPSPPAAMPETCTIDADCSVAKPQELGVGQPYCAQGKCLQAGYCSDYTDCLNPSNEYTKIECDGMVTCNRNFQCGVECIGSSCLEDQEYVTNCGGQTPCEAAAASNYDGSTNVVSCTNDYCGGCNTIQFDAAGNIIGGKAPTDGAMMTGSAMSVIAVVIVTMSLTA